MQVNRLSFAKPRRLFTNIPKVHKHLTLPECNTHVQKKNIQHFLKLDNPLELKTSPLMLIETITGGTCCMWVGVRAVLGIVNKQPATRVGARGESKR